MLFSVKNIIGALALAGVAAPKAAAMAPLSNDVHTETAAAQEIGSMTFDGFLVYSLNVCTIVQTTVCETSISTGAPAPSYGIPSDTSEPYEDSASTEYPVPTGDIPPPSSVTDGSPTATATATVTDGYTQTITTDGSDETAIDTATSSAPPSGTDDGQQSSSDTDSSATAPPSSTETTDAPSQGFSYIAAAHWGIKYILLIALFL